MALVNFVLTRGKIKIIEINRNVSLVMFTSKLYTV